MKVLLHVCCAACLLYPLKRLREDGHQVHGFFFNPNIFPAAEWQKRFGALRDLCSARGVPLAAPAQASAVFEAAVRATPAQPQRCVACWFLRLEETAQEARRGGYDAFTTTLLVSPYQDQDELRRLGEDAGRRAGVVFWGEDFRPGFGAAHEEARRLNIYRQNYCGCSFSLAKLSLRKNPPRKEAA